MKKFGIAMIMFIGLSSLAFGATTGNLVMTGTMSDKLDLVVAANGTATALDLGTTQTDLVVGTATISSNRTSWKIYLWSDNGSKLKTGDQELAYTFSIGALTGGTDITLPAAKPVAAQVDMATKLNAQAYNLSLSYTVNNQLTSQGGYTDTVRLEIAAN